MVQSFHIQWHITDICNCRCQHCYQDSFSPASQLSFSALVKIFENIKDFLQRKKVKLTVNLTGGEPLLHPDWKRLLEFLSAQPVVHQLGLITNGHFLDSQNCHFLSRFPGCKLKISAEAAEEKSYEFFRGPGRWEKFLQGIEQARKTGLEMTLMFTLLEINADRLEEVIQFAWEQKFHNVIIERFIPWGKGQLLKKSVISKQKWKQTGKFLLKVCGMEEDLSLLTPYRAFMLVKKKNTINLLGASCVLGKDGLALMPDGTVYPCRRFPLTIGNLRQQSLSEIWENSPILKMLRTRIFLKGKCQSCQVKNCPGCRAFAYALEGDFLEEDKLCFLGD